MAVATVVAVVACSGSGDGAAPAGSCKTGGTATGSYEAACNQCALEHCNAELKEKAGSGWATQHFGGDGACKELNACLCHCLSSASNPLTCTFSPECLMKADAACIAAQSAAQKCLNDQCPSVCR